MTETSKAWVWSQYKGVANDADTAPLPLFGGSTTQSGDSTSSKRFRWGASLATAMLVGLFFPKIAFLLLILAGFMVLSSMEPKRFEDFCNQVPGGSIILKFLAVSDAFLP